MHLQHVIIKELRRLTRRYEFLRRVSVTTSTLTLIWLYSLFLGERSTYGDHIEACAWKSWEEWPQEAVPHHLVLVADPQLVDPHTYPGRPWPLSTLTESYTDLYMSRNFRLINTRLDPDSIVFLGDFFDGGREWATDKAKKLKSSQRRKLEDLGVTIRSQEEMDADMKKAFVPGENGRWSSWTNKQWVVDLERFSKIFFSPQQLYPKSERGVFAAYELPTDPVNVENGANDVTLQEYAASGSKQRHVVASLPGNHDVGLGAGVQLVVRDRFESHFGGGNRIDILGNHTFISIDTPSLSARSQYLSSGFESDAMQYEELEDIWKPAMDFTEDLRTPAGRAVSQALAEYYPGERNTKRWQHRVTAPEELDRSLSTAQLIKETLEAKPQLPVILLSHVPLYRPPDTECGRMRERGSAISIYMGYQYQNVLTQTLSKDIVTRVSAAGDIAMAFSGDDHDYCDVLHKYNVGTWTGSGATQEDNMKTKLKHVKEITVKSFSWAMGVRRPGFLLVSLWNPVDAQGNTVGTPLPTVQTHLCLLPDQLGIFIRYGLLLALTLPVMLVRAVILALRAPASEEAEDIPPSPTKLSLPRFEFPTTNGSADTITPKAKAKSRQRGSSTSMSSHAHSNSNGHLGVQRSYNARTRSVSPTLGAGFEPQPSGGPLIEKAGYFPQVQWTDPGDGDSDEESNVGGDGNFIDDSQAKWKWRRRTPGRVRKALDEFGGSLLVVGLPAMLWYGFLIRNG